MWRVLVLAGVLASALAGRASQTANDRSLSALLDRYKDGDFNGAVRVGSALKNFGIPDQAFKREISAWVNRDAAQIERRRLISASFTLEVVRAQFETDSNSWRNLRDLVEWHCTQLRLNPVPASGERVWQLATVALAERALDRYWLTAETVSTLYKSPRHLNHVRDRFPGEVRFRLAAAVAASYEADHDIDGRASAPFSGGMTQVRARSEKAILAFTPLIADPMIGGDAEVHVSHLYFKMHNYEAALEHAQRAISVSVDPFVTYVAHILGGQALEMLTRGTDARQQYARALELIPGGQAATLALSSLQFLAGQASPAQAQVEHSLAEHGSDDDPWRLYYYGDFVLWPRLVQELHRAIR